MCLALYYFFLGGKEDMQLYNTAGQSKLADMFRAETRKSKDPSMSSEVDVAIGYPTTFLPLDFKNGMYNTIDNIVDGGSYQNQCLGIGDGTIVMCIGKAGTAKTTFAVQAATSIVAPYPNSVIIHEDLERGSSKSRIQNVSGWTPAMVQHRYILRQQGITAESFYERVKIHCNQKMEAAAKMPEEFTYFTGLFNSYGKPIYKIIPSVIILDSLPLLMPKDLTEEEKLAGQMSTTSQAKTNARIFRTIAPDLAKANVILFVVNHINQNVNISNMPKSAQINYLKQDETLPGGHMALYLSNNIIKFTTSTKLTDEKEFGINGFYSKVQLVKSRTNRAGQEVKMVYNQDYGFDRMLTNFVTLKEAGAIRGSGWYYFDGLEHMKFQQKGFLKKFYEEPIMREAMRDLSLEVFNTYIPKHDLGSSTDMSVDDVMANIVSAYNDPSEFAA